MENLTGPATGEAFPVAPQKGLTGTEEHFPVNGATYLVLGLLIIGGFVAFGMFSDRHSKNPNSPKAIVLFFAGLAVSAFTIFLIQQLQNQLVV